MKLCLLHTNDTHSYLGNFAKRAALIETIKAKNESAGVATLLFGTGDIFSGDIYFNVFKGKLEAELLSMLDYDAMTLGNHDFDGGSPLLADFIKDLTFPVVSSNIDFTRDPLLAGYVSSGEIVPYQILELAGERLGIFGLTTLETLEKGDPSKDLRFLDPIETAKKMVAQFQSQQVDKIILLSHLGDGMDRELASQVSGIDVIIGGHTHIVTENAIRVGDTLIVQAGHYGEFLGELQIEWEDQQLIAYQERIHEIAKVQEDETSQIYQRVSALKAEVEQKTSQVIATVAEDMPWDRKKLEHFQSPLGNIIADAFYDKAKELGYAPDLAVMNGGGIRTSLEKGPLTLADLIQLLPFSKHLVLIKVSGTDLIKALEDGLYPQVSHAVIDYTGLSDSHKRISHLSVIKDGQHHPFDPQQDYLVATNTFVGIGKDNYSGFKDAQVVKEFNLLDTEVLADYLKNLPSPSTYSHPRTWLVK